MGLFADHVPLRLRLRMAGEAVAAKAVHHFAGAADVDLRLGRRHRQFEEFPVLGGRVEAHLALDHGFRRNKLHDRSGRIDAAAGSVGGLQRVIDIAEDVADEKAAHRRHLADASERRLGDIHSHHGSDRRRGGSLWRRSCRRLLRLRRGLGAGRKRNSRQGSPNRSTHRPCSLASIQCRKLQ